MNDDFEIRHLSKETQEPRNIGRELTHLVRTRGEEMGNFYQRAFDALSHIIVILIQLNLNGQELPDGTRLSLSPAKTQHGETYLLEKRVKREDGSIAWYPLNAIVKDEHERDILPPRALLAQFLQDSERWLQLLIEQFERDTADNIQALDKMECTLAKLKGV